MGKTGKNQKNLKRQRLAAQEQIHTTSPDSDDEDAPRDTSFLLGLVSPQELAIAVRTINTLNNNPELLKSKAELKGLRGAVFDFQRISASQAGTGALGLCSGVGGELIR